MTIEYLDSKRITGLSDGVSSGYDVANISYSGKSSSSSSQNTYMLGIGFNADGTKMYRTGYSSTRAIFQYTLSTAWDISTASYDNVSFSLPSPQAVPYGFEWNGDGTKFVVGDSSTGDLYQYSLTTAYDISTTNSTPTTYDSSQATKPVSFKFINSGAKAFVLDNQTDTVFRYSLSTAYDITTMSYDSNSFTTTGYPTGLEFNSDGTEMYIQDHVGNSLRRYTLSTAYDLSTASLTSSFSTSSQFSSNTTSALRFSADGTKLYISGYGASDFQYDTVSTASDKTLLTNVQDNSIMVEKDTARRYWRTPASSLETESTGSYTWDGITASADNNRQGFHVATTSSAVYGKTINSVSFWLKRQSNTTGTAYCRVWSNANSGGTGGQVHEFGSIALSALTTDYVKYTFSTGSHTLAQYDTVGMEFTGSTSDGIKMQGSLSDVYDSTDTIRGRTTNGNGTLSPYSGHDIRFAITETIPATWTMNPTKEDNFNSWVTSNSAKFVYNSTNDNIDILNSNAYDNIHYDLGSVSDTKWLCRFKVTLTTAGSQSLGICYFYVGSTTGDANESNDGLGFYFYDNSNNTTALADNGNRPDQTAVTANLGISPSTTTYYAEMKRTSETEFVVKLFDNDSYTSGQLGSTGTLTISSSYTGLQYFKIMGYTTSGGLVGTLDDFKFYNGVTSIN